MITYSKIHQFSKPCHGTKRTVKDSIASENWCLLTKRSSVAVQVQRKADGSFSRLGNAGLSGQMAKQERSLEMGKIHRSGNRNDPQDRAKTITQETGTGAREKTVNHWRTSTTI